MTVEEKKQSFMKNITQKICNNKIKYVYYSMREINEHLKQVMGIKQKRKKDYTKAFVWIAIAFFTVVLWATIYNLIF